MFEIERVSTFFDGFFRIDVGVLVGLSTPYLLRLLFMASTGTGFIITLDLWDWILPSVLLPVVRSFEALIVSCFTPLSEIFLRIVFNRFFIPCSFFSFSCYSYLLFFSSYFALCSFFFRLFLSCDLLAWKELLRESQIELKDVFKEDSSNLAFFFCVLPVLSSSNASYSF